MLLVGGAFAENGVQNKYKNVEAEKLVKKIEKELKETGKYSENDLEKLIKTMEKTFNVKFNEKEKKTIKEYAVREIEKKIKIEKLKSRAISIKVVEPKKKVSNEGITYNIVGTGTSFTFYQLY